MTGRVVEKEAKVELLENPIPINYDEVPEFTREDYEARIEKVLELCDKRGYSHLIVYGDREHASNIHYLTGLDPRFEEALLILENGKKPKMILGNECYVYAGMIEIDIDLLRYHPFSLVGQPASSDATLLDLFKECGINERSQIGIAGWKYYDPKYHTLDVSILDVPSYIVETLCLLTDRGHLHNAMDIFTHEEYGIRHNISAKEIVYFEANGTKASRSVYNVIKNLREGISEIEASAYLCIDGEPLSMHPNVNFGEVNTSYGVRGPTYHQKLRLGDPICVGMAYRGSLVHRAGVYINTPDDLSEPQKIIREYFFHTYFKSIAAFYENFRIGNTCGHIYDVVDKTLGGGEPGGIRKFGIGLSPGHLIHTEEWTTSPFSKGNKTPIRSGMNVQCDYTAMHHDPYLTAHIEDGFVVADEKLRDEVRKISPSCYARIEARQKFMRDVIGIDVPDEVLPLSDFSGVFFPYMANPGIILSLE